MSNKLFAATRLAQLAMVGMLASASSAHAAYTIYVYQLGADVVASGSGTINTAGITLLGNTGPRIPDVRPNIARLLLGTGSSTQWQDINGPTSLGPSGPTSATSSSGAPVGIVPTNGSLFLPTGYVSGAQTQGTNAWAGRTLTSLGLTVGNYVYTWGTGATADSLTIRIGSAPPPPAATATSIPTLSEWGLIFMASLIGMFAMLRMRRGR